jgi:hypothetical protein
MPIHYVRLSSSQRLTCQVDSIKTRRASSIDGETWPTKIKKPRYTIGQHGLPISGRCVEGTTKRISAANALKIFCEAAHVYTSFAAENALHRDACILQRLICHFKHESLLAISTIRLVGGHREEGCIEVKGILVQEVTSFNVNLSYIS